MISPQSCLCPLIPSEAQSRTSFWGPAAWEVQTECPRLWSLHRVLRNCLMTLAVLFPNYFASDSQVGGVIFPPDGIQCKGKRLHLSITWQMGLQPGWIKLVNLIVYLPKHWQVPPIYLTYRCLPATHLEEKAWTGRFCSLARPSWILETQWHKTSYSYTTDTGAIVTNHKMLQCVCCQVHPNALFLLWCNRGAFLSEKEA